MMAGLDGIQNKIDPGQPLEKNIYDMTEKELKNIGRVPRSLEEAIDSLEKDHKFLLKGDVFTKDQIDAYAELLWEQVIRTETTPCPVEYDMYYSA